MRSETRTAGGTSGPRNRGTLVATTTQSNYQDGGVTSGTTYAYRVSVTGTDGTESWPTDPAQVTAK